VILELVDQRRLKLTDHLSHFVRNIPNGRKITVKELLSMTSGAYDFTDDPKFLVVRPGFS
jgi:D-alanyl-D-alanine carboxypeptidase